MTNIERYLRKVNIPCDVTILEAMMTSYVPRPTQHALSCLYLHLLDNRTIYDAEKTLRISRQYCSDLCSLWSAFLFNACGRDILRSLILTKIIDTNTLVYTLSQNDSQNMRKNYPDMFHAIYADSLLSIDLHLLVNVEVAHQAFFCRRSPPQETLLQNSIESALRIDFFERAWALNLQWNLDFSCKVQDSVWAIPPQARQDSIWYVPRNVAEKRLEWIFPNLRRLLRSEEARDIGLVLSGSMLPLCALKHEQFTDSEQNFKDFSMEVYKKFSVDFFTCVPRASSSKLRSTSYAIRDRFIALMNQQTGRNCVCERDVIWAEDDESWAMRNRRGHTFYFTVESLPPIQLIVMHDCSLIEAISQQHLPCVRAQYDGDNLLVSATCFISWMTRFIFDRPLFGRHINQQRKSKTVFKYAMRGWGFSVYSIDDLQMPSTLMTWLQDWDRKKPLPYYHLLYNPMSWPKWMTPDRVANLLEYVDV